MQDLSKKKILKICCKYYLNDIWETLILKKRKGMIFHHPQTKFAKVMFLQVSVCPQRGAIPAQVHPLLAGTPQARTTPLDRYSPQAGTPPGQVHPHWQVHPQAGTLPPPDSYTPGQVHPPPGRYTPPGRYPTSHSACWDTVNKQAVRIPRECILVVFEFEKRKISTPVPL